MSETRYLNVLPKTRYTYYRITFSRQETLGKKENKRIFQQANKTARKQKKVKIKWGSSTPRT